MVNFHLTQNKTIAKKTRRVWSKRNLERIIEIFEETSRDMIVEFEPEDENLLAVADIDNRIVKSKNFGQHGEQERNWNM